MTAVSVSSVDVVDRDMRDRAVERFREAGIVLPTFEQLAEPAMIPPASRTGSATVAARRRRTR